jgi:hypothetical protein
MKFALAGLGKQNGWTVELDEIIDTELYGISIHNIQFSFQIYGFPLGRVLEFQRFLRTRDTDQVFVFHTESSGRVEFAEHDKLMFLRLLQQTSFGTNLVEIAIASTECDYLAAAIQEAVKDAESTG